MTIATWNPRYATGIEIIDAQHQALFEALNRLSGAFRDGTSGQHTEAGLDALLAYTLEHFRTEEAFMRERAYPGLATHAAEHELLAKKAQELESHYRHRRPVAMDLAIFLADLLARHIDTHDLAMARFLREEPPTVTVQRL